MSERERIKDVLAKALEPMFSGHNWLMCRNDWIDAEYWVTEDGERVKKKLRVDIGGLANAIIPLMPMRHESPPTDQDPIGAGSCK